MTNYTPTFPRNIWEVPRGKSAEGGFRVWFDAPHANTSNAPAAGDPTLVRIIRSAPVTGA
jgi:hypothetical protein